MKQYSYLFLAALALSTILTSCELAGDIFQAGFYAAFIVVILVVILVIWLIRKFRR